MSETMRRLRTARRLRDLHAERNALSVALDREATDHAEAIRQRDELRAECDAWKALSKAQDRLLVAYRLGDNCRGAKASLEVSAAREALLGRDRARRARAAAAAALAGEVERWNDEHKAMQCLRCGGLNVGEPEDYHRPGCAALAAPGAGEETT